MPQGMVLRTEKVPSVVPKGLVASDRARADCMSIRMHWAAINR